MSGSWNHSLRKQLQDKAFRAAYVAENIRTGLAFQIRALREARGLSQSDLGACAGKKQSAIARLEDPDYGRFSLTTLLEIASAFDVGLLVRFVPFHEITTRNADLSPTALQVPSFSDDPGFNDHGGSTLSGSSSAIVVNLMPHIQQAESESSSASNLPMYPRTRESDSMGTITGKLKIA